MACPVGLAGAMTEIDVSVPKKNIRLILCPSCLITLEKVIKLERDRVLDERKFGARAGRK